MPNPILTCNNPQIKCCTVRTIYGMPLARLLNGLLLSISVLIISACSSSDDNGSTTANGSESSTQFAFVSGTARDFGSGQIERLTLGETIESTATYPGTGSDIVVRSDGESIYQLGRSNLESLTKYSVDDQDMPVFQYSVVGDNETTANPHDLVFVDESKAYLIRYDSPTVWIVNPSATTEADFKIGELDLSAYADRPTATDALILNGRLYVLMQRLESQGINLNPVIPGYIAVFDTTTDTEIDTGLGNNGLSGIELNSLNPLHMQYVESTDEILVLGRGNLFVVFNSLPGDPYQGGVESVSLEGETYTLDTLLDDGTAEQNEGFFSEGIAVNANRGYVVAFQGYDENFVAMTNLRSYNVTTGLLDEGVVAGLENVDITTLAVGPQGRLWVGLNGDNPGFMLIDPADNSIIEERIPTQFVPNYIVFTSN